jgi:hypothetical protein
METIQTKTSAAAQSASNRTPFQRQGRRRRLTGISFDVYYPSIYAYNQLVTNFVATITEYSLLLAPSRATITHPIFYQTMKVL